MQKNTRNSIISIAFYFLSLVFFTWYLMGCSAKESLLHQCPVDNSGNEVNALRVFEYHGESGMFQAGRMRAEGCLVVQCGNTPDVLVDYEGRGCLVRSNEVGFL